VAKILLDVPRQRWSTLPNGLSL